MPDLDQQADYNDGTYGWTAEAYDSNRTDPVTGGYRRLGRIFLRARTEEDAYDMAREGFNVRGVRKVGRVITIRPASYADLELEPVKGAL